MAKSKKPNFLSKLLRKSSQSEDNEEFDEPPEFDEEQSSNSDLHYEEDGHKDEDIEKALEERPEADFDADFEDGEDEDINFEDQRIFQLSEQQKKELDDLDHTHESPAPELENSDPSTDRDIDIEAIKNYQITEEDEDEDQTLGSYREFTPTQERSFTKTQHLLARLKRLNPLALFSSLKTITRKKGKSASGGGFQWDQFVESIFGPNSRPHVHKIFLIGLIITSTYCLGKVAAIILRGAPETRAPRQTQAPQSPQNNWREGINKVKTANLFNAKMTEEKEKDKEPQKKKPDPVDKNLVCDSAKKASDLPIKLLNTIVLQDSVKSIAAVQVRGDRELKNIREGEKINGMAEVGKITRLNMIFKNLDTGECEYVANREFEKQQKRQEQKNLDVVDPEQGKKLMQDKDGRIQNEGNKFTIKKSVRNEMLGNINEVLTQAKAVQIKNPDGSYSFKMTEIVPGSIYSKLGLENGDIITGINGDKIENVNQLMSMFGQIKDIDHFELKVKRNGSEQTQEYTFQ